MKVYMLQNIKHGFVEYEHETKLPRIFGDREKAEIWLEENYTNKTYDGLSFWQVAETEVK